MLTVVLIHGVVSAPHERTAGLLSLAPLTYLGRISYGTYLWHWPIIVLLRPLYDLDPYTLALVAVVSSTVLAALSARLVETAIRTSATFDREPRRVIGASLACSVAIAILIVPSALTSERRPVEAARTDRSRIACPHLPACLPMIDDQIVFHNQLHLSDAWTVSRRHQLFEVIERTGVLESGR